MVILPKGSLFLFKEKNNDEESRAAEDEDKIVHLKSHALRTLRLC